MVCFVLAGDPQFVDPATIKLSVLSDNALSTLVNYQGYGNSDLGKQVKRLAQGELDRREVARGDLNEDLSPDVFKPSEANTNALKAMQKALAKIPKDPLLDGVPLSQWIRKGG